MKKLLRYALVCAMVMIGSAAMADTTTVGSEDNSTEWWSAFSDYYTIAPNKTLHLNSSTTQVRAATGTTGLLH